jgi:hypothetical protein
MESPETLPLENGDPLWLKREKAKAITYKRVNDRGWGRPFPQAFAKVGIPAKEILCSDLMSIIYRAQRSRHFHVERSIAMSQEKSLI